MFLITSIPDLLFIKSVEVYMKEYLNFVKIFLTHLISFLTSIAATYSASVLDNMIKD